MNSILFDAQELDRPLPASDPRVRHLRTVLRRQPGDSFDCGRIDGPRGRARIEREDAAGWHLSFTWGEEPPPLPPLHLVAGLPRPQTARKILGDAAAIGVESIAFFAADKGEPSYASSQLWSGDEVRRLLVAGAAQAFCTRLPHWQLRSSLDEILDCPRLSRTNVALDNYEAAGSLSEVPLHGVPATLAIGPERGWSSRERDRLRAAGFTLAHLGSRVLRSETACVAGLTLLKARLGLW